MSCEGVEVNRLEEDGVIQYMAGIHGVLAGTEIPITNALDTVSIIPGAGPEANPGAVAERKGSPFNFFIYT